MRGHVRAYSRRHAAACVLECAAMRPTRHFRFSEEADSLLIQIAEFDRTTRTEVLERMIAREADRLGMVPAPPLPVEAESLRGALQERKRRYPDAPDEVVISAPGADYRFIEEGKPVYGKARDSKPLARQTVTMLPKPGKK